MFTLALRNVRENPSRYVLTGLAIALGVAFYVATTVLTSTVDRSISGSVDDLYEGVDAVVRSTEVFETDFFDIRSPLDDSVIDEVSNLGGVDAVQPVLSGYAQLVGNDGKVIADNNVAFVWSESDDLNGYSLVEGSIPTGLNEVIVDEGALASGNLQVGDAIRILPRQQADMTIVGSMRAPGGSVDGTATFGATLETLSRLYGSAEITSLNVASTTVDGPELVRSLDDSVGVGLEVVSGQTVADEFKELLNQFVSIISIFLTVFAFIALFVAVFVIYNTFTITVTQRIKEMALLRAIGASRRQVLRNVLLESIAVGLIASAIGVVIGVGLGWVLLRVFDALGFPLSGAGLAIETQGLVIGFVIGLVVTIVSAVVPARRGASVPPIEALRSTAIEEVNASRVRSIIGFAMIVVGAIFATIGATQTSTVPAVAGVLGLFLGIVLAAPAIAPGLARLLGRPLIKFRDIVGELASENAARNPKRTATTAMALMIGVTLVTAATVIAASFRESIRGDIDRAITAELVVEAGSGFLGGIDPEGTNEIRDLPGLRAASTIRPIEAEVNGSSESVTGVHATDLGQVLNIEVTSGALADIVGESIGISDDSADDLGVTVGDTIQLATQLIDVPVTVAAIYDGTDIIGEHIIDASLADIAGTQPLDSLVLIATDDADATRPAITEILAGDPTATVKTGSEYADDQAGQLNTLLNLLYGLLALSVLIALLGVANTMTLSIHERTRELGLLRAVGMSGQQLRSAIRYESALIGLVGSITGLLLGVFFGWLAHRATISTFPVFSLPIGPLLLIAVVGILAGLVAGWRPANRASKLNILEAISHS